MEAHRIAVIRQAAAALVAIAAVHGSPAQAARAHKLDLPAGPFADSVRAMTAQTGSSIGVDDATVWQRRVPALKGVYSVPEAIRRLLGDGAQTVAAAPDVWRVRAVRRPPPPARAPARPPAAPPPPAPPQDDIVVTASKRDVRLSDYAGSVSVVAGADLTFGGVGGTDAVLSRLATVSSTFLGAGRNKLFIRGIADSSFTGPTQATVGQYLGDVRLTYNAPDPDLRLYDVQSVEVLEGPQGTLYGAGSLGGIIRTVPNVPVLGATTGSLTAGVSATEHGAPSGDVAGAANVPVVGDTVALRVVGYGVSDGGYIDNPLLHRDDINRTTIAGGRATVRAALGDWTVDLGGVFQHTIGDDSQYADAGSNGLERSSPVTEGFDASYRLGQLVVANEIGDLRFRSTTAIIGQTLDERYDATPQGGAPRIFRQRNATDLVTSEARLWQPLGDRFGWVVGGSFVHNRTRLERALGDLDVPAPVTGVENRVTELTAYGEASYRLTPWLVATGGGRISHASLSGEANAPVAVATVAEALLRAAIAADRNTTSVLPSFALLASPLPRLTVYARYQEGLRPGGLAIDGGFVRRFQGDRVATAEAGIRYGTPGRTPVDLSLVLSHTRWSDIQADFLDSTGLPTTDNIGDGRIWSIATSIGWHPVAGLRLDAAFAFNDGRVTDPSPTYRSFLTTAAAIGFVNAGIDRIPNVARITGRLGVDWQHALGETLTLHVGGWGRYVGKSRIGVGPVLGAEQGDYPDSAVTVRVGTPTLGVTLGATNLSDSIGNRFALGTPFVTGRQQITPLRPRTIRLGFDFSF